jgi:hypothetical protein
MTARERVMMTCVIKHISLSVEKLNSWYRYKMLVEIIKIFEIVEQLRADGVDQLRMIDGTNGLD